MPFLEGHPFLHQNPERGFRVSFAYEAEVRVAPDEEKSSEPPVFLFSDRTSWMHRTLPTGSHPRASPENREKDSTHSSR